MKYSATLSKKVTLFLIALFTFAPFYSFAQNEGTGSPCCSAGGSKLSFTYGTDLVSRYVWRGMEFGASGTTKSVSPHIQPSATLSYNLGHAGSVSVGFWGSYGFDGEYNENDLSLNYTVATKAGTFGVTFNDYYYPYLGIPFSNTESDGKGAHTVDAQLSYTLPEAFPLTVMVSNNVHNDVPDNKSLYIEASYPFTIGENSLSVFSGVAKGPSIWHAVTTDQFEFVNVGLKASKSIKVTESFSLNTGLAWIYNVHQKKTFLVFKLTL